MPAANSAFRSLEQTKAGLRVKSTKSDEPRNFVVPESALSVLADHRTEQDKTSGCSAPTTRITDLIFCQPNGAYYSPDRVGARVKELMVAVGLKGVSLHSLRHTSPRNYCATASRSRRSPTALATPTRTSR